MNFSKIYIDDIILKGENFDRYLVTYPLGIAASLEPIQRFGLINPPSLVKIAGGKYRIICGYRRILACKELKINKIDAKVFEMDEIGDKTAIMMSIVDNVSTRTLNAVEISNAIIKLKEFSACEDKDIPSLLGIPPSPKTAGEYAGINNLDNKLKHNIASGLLTPAHVFLLLKMREDDRNAVSNLLINTIRPNINETKEIIQYLGDIRILLKKESISEILGIAQITSILNNDDLNPREKVERLRGALKRLRYPMITEKETAFRDNVQALGLPNNTTVSHPKYFEGNELNLEFRIKSAVELEKILKILSRKSVVVKNLIDLIKS